MTWNPINWFVIIIYFLGMLSVGFYFAKRNKSSQDYFTASGRVPTFVAACSIYATMLSSLSFIAIPATIFSTNWVNGLAPIGIIFLAITVAHIFVPFVRRLQIITAYEYLEVRFQSRALRLLSSITFIAFHIIRIAIVVYLPTLAFMAALPGIDPTLLAISVAIFCTLYTSEGGIEAVVWSDTIQTFVLIIGAALTVYFGFRVAPGGLAEAFSVLQANNKTIPTEAWGFSLSKTTVWVIIIGAYMNSIYNYIASQDVVQRYSTVKNLKDAQRSLYINAPLLIVSMIMFIGVGSALYLFYHFNAPAPSLDNKDAIFPYFIINNLPPVVSGFVMAGLLSATQSTISSSLNSTATCLVTDIVAPYKKLEDIQKLQLGRLFSWSIGILGTLLALLFLKQGRGEMFFFLQVITALLGGPIATVFLIGIFFKQAGRQSAWTGFVVSTIVSVLLIDPMNMVSKLIPFYQKPELYAFALPIIIFGCGLLAGYLSSFVFPKPDSKLIEGMTIESLKDLSDIA